MPFYYYGMYGNRYYMIGTILVMIAAIFALWAQMKVQSTYSYYKRVTNHRRLSGAMVAREILDREGLYDIEVCKVGGNLTDHYQPANKRIHLSKDIYEGTSLASLAVAAHECGHAIQYKVGYFPISLRNAILPFANIGQYLGWIAILIGLCLGYTRLAWYGFFLMCGILLFQIVTLPVELNASSRALTILQQYYLDCDEYVGAQKMLRAAAMTYVAAMFSTLMSMLRIFLMILSHSRDDE